MLRSFSPSFRRLVAVTLLAAFVPLASACFGSFTLTRKLMGFNQNISSSKWIRWFVFLGLVFIPVYEIANLVDAFVLNSLEFWTGQNPLAAAPEPRTLVLADGSVAHLVPVENGARIEVWGAAGGVHAMTLLREEPGVVAAYDENGTLVRKLVGLGGDETRIVEVAAGR